VGARVAGNRRLLDGRHVMNPMLELLATIVGAALAIALAWLVRHVYVDYRVRVFRREIALHEAQRVV
jgi:hypothetical protein